MACTFLRLGFLAFMVFDDAAIPRRKMVDLAQRCCRPSAGQPCAQLHDTRDCPVSTKQCSRPYNFRGRSGRLTKMDDHTGERWYQLCQLAAIEQDSDKLLALVTEINRLLAANEADCNKREAHQREAWKQTAQPDEHQAEARQPYRSREHRSDATANDSERSRPKRDSQDSE
jgi:hypothetical protein